MTDWFRGLLTVVGIGLLVLAAGCSDSPPPEDTLARLGAEVGDAAQDQTDFNALLSTYTTDRYADETDPELVNYQLFLVAKAADLVLNQAEPPDTIDMEVETDGDAATVTFELLSRVGLFAVADISTIRAELVDTGAEEFPWRIDQIDLER